MAAHEGQWDGDVSDDDLGLDEEELKVLMAEDEEEEEATVADEEQSDDADQPGSDTNVTFQVRNGTENFKLFLICDTKL